MEFLKQHYEKLILSVVLLGLAAAAALMPMKVSQEKDKETERKEQLIPKTVKPIEEVDITTNKMILQQLDHPPDLQLSGGHNVFNPVKWQKRPDGSYIKIQTGEEVGLNAWKVTEITPLVLRVTFDDVLNPGADNQKYQVSLLRETEKNPRPNIRTAAVGDKNNIFSIQEVKGPAENPTAIVVLLAGEKQPITVSRGKPYERIIGYSANLFYEAEKLPRKSVRAKDKFIVGGETYNIVAINANEVVMSVESNKKQRVLQYSPAQK
jgi:hypothetical protein